MCDIMVLWGSLNRMPRRTAQCRKVSERKRWRLAAEKERAVTSREVNAYGCPLDMVIYFRYLGREILAADNNWPAVVRKFSQARSVCKRMTQILSREGADPRVSGFFFKYVVQAVLLFGLETWVVTPLMGRALGGFQDQVERRLTGRIPWKKTDRKWEYTSTATARDEAGLQTTEEYIWRRKNTVA